MNLLKNRYLNFNKKILDIVEELIGPNILCWSSDFFIKYSVNKNTFIANESRDTIQCRIKCIFSSLINVF